MRRIMLLIAVLGALITTPAVAETYFGFRIGITNAPPPPRVYFRQRPDVVYMPQTRVYVVRNADYDMFRYGRFWYVTQNGYWYRSRDYRGPFRVVDARYVPGPIYRVPAQHWKHRRWERADNHDRGDDRDRAGNWDRGDDRDREGNRDQERDEDRADWDRGDRTYFGFNINIMNAPPPPPVYFRGQPTLSFVPETRVYVVQDFNYDMFRYGDSWYVCRDGYWYQSRDYRGPFRVVSAREVPEPIYRVPVRHWKDWRGDNDRDGDRSRSKERGREGNNDGDRDDDR